MAGSVPSTEGGFAVATQALRVKHVSGAWKSRCQRQVPMDVLQCTASWFVEPSKTRPGNRPHSHLSSDGVNQADPGRSEDCPTVGNLGLSQPQTAH